MKRSAIPTIAWVLVGVLALAAILLTAGEQDSNAQPAVSSSTPSGLAAFAQLLREKEISFVVSTDREPELKPNDVAVAFWLVDANTKLSNRLRTQTKKCTELIFEHVHKGGAAIILPLRQDFLDASRSTVKTAPAQLLVDGGSKRLSLSDSGISTDQGFSPMDEDEEDSTSMDLWSSTSPSFFRAYRSGKGTVFIVRDAIGITNRFVDHSQNAEAFGRIFAMAAASGKRLVFTEASFGHMSQKGLLQSVGAWANAAWQQLLFLGLVVAFTLGKRFGLPEQDKQSQRGSRELLDAIADTYQRAGTTQTALFNAYRDADTDLRIFLKISKDAPRTQRDQMLPESLQKALARLEVGGDIENVSKDQGLSLIKDAQKELDAFYGPRRPRARRLAKL